MKITNGLCLTLLILLFQTQAHAGVIGWDFSWTGSGFYSMTGNFTYDDTNAGDGAIRDSEVQSPRERLQ